MGYSLFKNQAIVYKVCKVQMIIFLWGKKRKGIKLQAVQLYS